MRCVTQIKFQNIFENLFFEGQKSRLFKTKVFFLFKKSGNDKKIGDAKVDKKSSKNHHNQKEGKAEQEKCAPPPKKREKQNKENQVKN